MVSIAVREVSLSGVPVVKAFVNREMNIEDAVSVRSRSPFEDVLIGRGDGPGHARGGSRLTHGVRRFAMRSGGDQPVGAVRL